MTENEKKGILNHSERESRHFEILKFKESDGVNSVGVDLLPVTNGRRQAC